MKTSIKLLLASVFMLSLLLPSQSMRSQSREHTEETQLDITEPIPEIHLKPMVRREGVHVTNGGLEDFKEEDGLLHNQLLSDEFIYNKEHIYEHLKEQEAESIDLTNATPEELEFHFFKIHDYNNDKLLDGIELMNAIGHGLDEQIETVMMNKEMREEDKDMALRRMKANQFSSVDRILHDDDINNDGYISYMEYVKSRRASHIIKLSAEKKL